MLTRLFVLLPLVVLTAFTAWILPLVAAVMVFFAMLVIGIVLNFYPDKFLLHFLQARETTETEFPLAYRLAGNQAFKLRITAPRIYTYSGFFHRAFVFAASNRSVFVVEREVLTKANSDELAALWFALALQVKEKSAKKSTLALLSMAICWVPMLRLLSLWRMPPPVLSWVGQYLVAPVASRLHRMGFPQTSIHKLLKSLAQFPYEEARLKELNARFTQPRLHLSIGRDFTYRIGTAAHRPREQMILAIEGALHPFE